MSEVIKVWTIPIAEGGGNDARWDQFVKGKNGRKLHFTAAEEKEGSPYFPQELKTDLRDRKEIIFFLQLTGGQKLQGEKIPAGLCAIAEPDYEQINTYPIGQKREDSFYHPKFMDQRRGFSKEILIPIKLIDGTDLHIQPAIPYDKCKPHGWTPGRKICRNWVLSQKSEITIFKELLR